MIDEPGSFLRDQQLGETGARPARQQAYVVADLVKDTRKRAQRPDSVHQRVVRP